jgi:hypothetical protein
VRPDGGEQDGDAAVLEVGDQVGEGLGAGAVQHAEGAEPQDDDLDVADLGQLEQEALRGAEEQRAVQAVGDDVLVEQLVLERRVDPVGAGRDVAGKRRGVGYRLQG